MTCGRTKCTQLIQNVIGETICEETIKKLKEQKFSIIIDEATDRGTVKNLAVVTRLLHKNEPKDFFLALLEPKTSDAVGLYCAIKDFFS